MGIRWIASFKQRRPTPVLLILVKSSYPFCLTRLLSPFAGPGCILGLAGPFDVALAIWIRTWGGSDEEIRRFLKKWHLLGTSGIIWELDGERLRTIEGLVSGTPTFAI